MNELRRTFILFSVLFILTGIVYPLIVTAIGQMFFKEKVNGSIIYKDDIAVASKLIGQPFQSPGFFWSRPSSTEGFPYNALNSGGSNLAVTNPVLINQFRERIDRLEQSSMDLPVPSCLVQSSASGLDPEITTDAAYAQVDRISKHTGIPKEELISIIRKHEKKRSFSFLGADRVNVVELNLALIQLLENEHGYREK